MDRKIIPIVLKIFKSKYLYLALIFISAGTALSFWVWTPGKIITDGRYDLGTNGIWIQHGWLGHDKWFKKYKKDTSLFRNTQKIKQLADRFERYGIKNVFPHLCPCDKKGSISKVDDRQTELFLKYFKDFTVLPWIGGVLNTHCFLEDQKWRQTFINSAKDLLISHPGFSGVHINIEPLNSGNNYFLIFLEELRQALPKGKIISVAAYPPPTLWHPIPKVNWNKSYFQKVSKRVDQIAVMMYDTGIRWGKMYQFIMSNWTDDILKWTPSSKILMGIPAYDGYSVNYHKSEVENLANSLTGIQAGLNGFKKLPDNYEGIAVYCEWEMDAQEWNYLKTNFLKTEP